MKALQPNECLPENLQQEMGPGLSKRAVKSSLGKYFSMIITSSRHSEVERTGRDSRDEKNEKSENEFSSIARWNYKFIYRIIVSLHRFAFAFWEDLQSISLRDYHLMSSLMSISVKLSSQIFMAFNVHFLPSAEKDKEEVR